MPKKKFNLLTKIKFVFWWLFNYRGTMTIVTCGKCNGKRVTFRDSKQDGNVYTSEYICEDCGAIGKCTEIWSDK